jgi:hypothetical protein
MKKRLPKSNTKIRRVLKAILISFTLIIESSNLIFAQSIILGRPTDNSVTASILFATNVDFYLEYGTQSGIYTNTINTINNTPNTPDEVDFLNLFPDTRYYYRLRYRPVGIGNYTASPEYTFHTQRPPGSNFTFTIEADEHLYDKKGVDNMYRVTLNNQAIDNPDFMLSLGDIFGDDHYPDSITSVELDSLHKDYIPFLSSICHSIPFYVCLGNHEGENDYYLAQTPPNNLAVWGTLWRKFYFPNPYPNNFYSGNTTVEPYGVGNPENYYAWTWGDALFVVLDVYRDQCDTSPKPKNWDWSLGLPQYTWLQNTLQNSSAKYKFVFAHHIRGQGRGGITNAKLFEWGGYEQNGTAYTFPSNRPGWAKPIHQLFVDNDVTVFFQGHDHLFAHEILDSVTYQEVPMAADSTYEIGMLANAGAYTADTIEGTGHLRVNVTPNCVTVDFIRAYLPADTVSGLHHNGEVAFTYSVGACNTSGVKNINESNAVSIFPNPAKDKLAIRLNEGTEKYQISLFNTIGQNILKSFSNNLDVSHVPNGMYLVNIKTEKFEVNKKVIINH